MRHLLRVFSALCVFVPTTAVAQDVVVTPGPGGGFVVQDDTGTFERFRIDEETAKISYKGDLFLHNGVNTNSVYFGRDAGHSVTGTVNNVGVGVSALYHNTAGTDNTALGSGSLFSNTGGDANTALGNATLGLNTLGSQNVAVGDQALFSNTTGVENTAVGSNAISPT